MIRALASKEDCIYLDYQASSPVDEEVLEVLIKYSRSVAANPHASDHIMGWNAMRALRDQLDSIAADLGCDSDEIVFTSGATESNNLAILGLAEAAAPTRKRILVSAIEHKCVLDAAQLAARRYGHTVEIIPVDRQGILSVSALEAAMAPDVLMVSVMLVNNEVGSLQPIAEAAALAEKHGAFLHTDGAHALACGPMSFRDSRIHALSLSGHKIYGPKGVGLLLIRRDAQDILRPQIVGGGQQYGLRSGTVPVPMCAALASAIRLMAAGDHSERARIAALRDRFAQRLLNLPGVHLNGPELNNRHPGNLNLRFDGWEAHDLLARLQPYIAASSGSACTSGMPEPSYVLRAMSLSDVQAASSVRFGFGRGLNVGMVDKAVDIISAVLR